MEAQEDAPHLADPSAEDITSAMLTWTKHLLRPCTILSKSSSPSFPVVARLTPHRCSAGPVMVIPPVLAWRNKVALSPADVTAAAGRDLV